MDFSKKTFRIAICAIGFAVIFLAIMLDKLISLALPVSMAAVVLLVTFSLCFVFDEWLFGFLTGVFFGLASFLKAFVFGEATFVTFGIGSILIYVLPRCLVGIGAFAVYKLVLMLLQDKKSPKCQHMAMVVAVFVGLVLNTVLFLSALNIGKSIVGEEYSALILTIKAVMFTNIIPEYLISLVLVPFVVMGVRRGLKLGVDGDNMKRAREAEKTSVSQN